MKPNEIADRLEEVALRTAREAGFDDYGHVVGAAIAHLRATPQTPDLYHAAKAVIDYCDAYPPMAESLWCVKQLREALKATPQTPVAVPQAVLDAIARMSTPLDESRLTGVTAQADADCMKVIADFINSLTAPQPAGPQTPVAMGEPVAWYSKLYGVCWMSRQLWQFPIGTIFYANGEPAITIHGKQSMVWLVSGASLQHGTVFYANAAPQPAAVEATGEARQGQQSTIVFTLREAEELVKFFGGEDTEVSVMNLPDQWGDMPKGLYAYCTDYPEEGASYLGASEVADSVDAAPSQPAEPVAQAEQPSPIAADDGQETGHPEADRVIARLASSDPDFNDCADAVALIWKLVTEHRGPEGYATWKDAAIAERMRANDALSRTSDRDAIRDAALTDVATSILHAFSPDDRLDPKYIADCIMQYKSGRALKSAGKGNQS